MSLKRLTAAFSLASAAALSGCAAYVTPHGRIGVGVSVPGPVYVAPTPVYPQPVYTPPVYVPPPVYVAPMPRYYAPMPRYYAPRPYYGPRYRNW